MAEWSRRWRVWKRDGSGGVEGPSTAIDFNRAEKVEVVPKQEAEEKIEAAKREERKRLHSKLRKLALKYPEPTRYELLEAARHLLDGEASNG